MVLSFTYRSSSLRPLHLHGYLYFLQGCVELKVKASRFADARDYTFAPPLHLLKNAESYRLTCFIPVAVGGTPTVDRPMS